ncbi:cytochrome P450 [Corynespora cassiicola Philippines]|uniref:Cytochrome P450 n=1 Tax=Corynespora cassiicola Philippines TaxID=1448308 RepID=A0A2T2P9V0_CORCC|nr:cytochrome P450 [Corynespora cassiicola Philippines]
MALSTEVLAALVVAVVLGAVVAKWATPEADPREPPVLRPAVPFIGHLIGMVWQGPPYLAKLSKICKSPIFTLPILSGRTYVVTSPALAALVQRNSSTLDFNQLIVATAPRMMGISDEATKIIADAKAKEEGRLRMVESVMHTMVQPLLGANKIEALVQSQLDHFSDWFSRVEDGQEFDLHRAVTREVSLASMRTFYGPKNPFAIRPELVEEFWDWEAGVIKLMLRFFPKIIARKAYYGLEKMTAGFVEYINNGGFDGAYEMLYKRWKAHQEVGISIEDQARLEIGMCLGINVNASGSSFWVLNHIFSRPELLAELREEIQQNAVESPGVISYTRLRDSCPLLNSVYRETLRLAAPLTSARYVTKDTIIADTYLLRADNVVQIVGGVIHSDQQIWGPDVDEFNPRRFLYSASGHKTGADGVTSDDKSQQIHSAAFRAYGGGVTLCPGRHFAQLEVLGYVAVMALAFDLLPPKGQEKVQWDPPKQDKQVLIAVVKPTRPVNVRVQRRESVEHVKWAFKP